MKSSSKPLTSPKYRADIDGLRAIAVLSVVGFHAFPEWVKGGFIGVDIFFVISGFLISTIIFENLEKETFSFKVFYTRRINRIFPALLVLFIFCFVAGWLTLLPGEFKQLGKHIAGGASFISNFVFWNEVGYFDNTADTKPLLHLWSLGIEEQFYIIWPFLLWFCWKRKFNLFFITSLIVVISFYLNIKGVKDDPVATFYSPQTRFWELLLGSLLSWIFIYKKDVFSESKNNSKLYSYLKKYSFGKESHRKLLNNLFSILGLLFIAYGIYETTQGSTFPGTMALLPTFGTVLIISAGANAWVNRVVLSNRILVWLGIISFPLYLWHWPLLTLIRIIENESPTFELITMGVVISILLSWLTYKLVERPLRFGKHDKVKVVLLSMLMVGVAVGGHQIYERDGIESRFENQQAVLDLFSRPRYPVESVDCSKVIPEFRDFEFNKGGCMMSKASEPTVMFIGDSHMSQYRPAVWKHFSSESIMMVVEHYCFPFSSNHSFRGECKEKANAIIDFLNSNKSIKTVYMTAYWSYLMTGGSGSEGMRWRNSLPVINDVANGFKQHGIEFISKIINSNKEVVFLKDIPDLDFDIQSCFDVRPFRLTSNKNIREDCSFDYATYKKRVKKYDNVIDEILSAFPQIKVYDPEPLFCGNGRCHATDGFLPYYENGDHLNHYGAEMVIKDMCEVIPTNKESMSARYAF